MCYPNLLPQSNLMGTTSSTPLTNGCRASCSNCPIKKGPASPDTGFASTPWSVVHVPAELREPFQHPHRSINVNVPLFPSPISSTV